MPVCVSGMHRSGTSMVANMLSEAGLFLGPEVQMMPPAADNPEGFWENIRFVGVNDIVLAQLGGAWDLPPATPAFGDTPELAGIREVATEIVASFAGAEPWGWKDPRNCLTVPFWESVAGPLRHVFVVRNPLEVARSLNKRDGFSLPLALSIWHRYTSRFLADTKPEDRLVTHFDAYFGDVKREVRRVLAFAGLPADEETVGRAATKAAPGLKHHRLTVADLIEADVDPVIVDLYVALCQEADFASPISVLGDRPTSDRPPRQPFRAASLEPGTGRFPLWFFSQQQRVLELEVASAVNQLARNELEGRLNERDGMVLEREARIAERDARIAERERAFTRLTHEISVLRQTIEDQVIQIDGLTDRVAALTRHETELRDMLAASQDHLLFHDAEIMGTLGAVLARVAPGAPAAIYYRQLVHKVRSLVDANLPKETTALVATFGDDELLDLGVHQALPFPQADTGVAADYTSVDNDVAISQLEALRASGAAFLVVPSPAQAWLARLPALGKHIERRYPAIVDEFGTCTIYALRGSPAA